MVYEPKLDVRGRVLATLRIDDWRDVHRHLVRLLGFEVPGMRTALAFYESDLAEDFPRPNADALSELLGIDFHSPVCREILEPGRIMACHVKPGGEGERARVGGFLTRPGTGLDMLGLQGSPRRMVRVSTLEAIPALHSRVAATVDTWSDPDRKAWLAMGRGEQWRIPKSATRDGRLHVPILH
ncbi:MAG: hypothetical protein U1F36_12950 [Planctomycetota bacterium]